MFKHVLFLILTDSLLFQAHAQHDLAPGCSPLTYTIYYTRNDSAVYDNSNEILREFSKDAVKNLNKTKIVIDFQVCRKDTGSPGGPDSTILWFSSPVISGDHKYRGFDLRPLLKPDRISGVLGFYNKFDSSFTGEMPLLHLKWPSMGDIVVSKPLKEGQVGGDSLVLQHLKLWYDEDAYNAFTERQRLIDDYFAASAILDSLAEMTEKVRLDNPSAYPELFIRLEEINKILSLIAKRNFPESLGLKDYDPLDVEKKFNEMYKRSLSLTMTFRERMNGIPPFPDNATEDSLIRTWLSGMQRYIRWSMLVNDRNSGIYKEYLDNYFSIPAFGNDPEMIRSLISAVYPGLNPDSVLQRISGKIKRAYDQESGDLEAGNHFAEGVDLLEIERRFIDADPYLPAGADSQQSLEQAAGGIYNSYVAVADFALGLRRYTLAENYLQKARDYRKSRQGLRFPDSLYSHVIRELFSYRIADCDTLKANAAYGEALDCYTAFRKSYDSLSRAYLSTDLDSRISECRYHLLYHEGIVKFGSRDFIEAGRCFAECVKLQQSLRLAADSTLGTLFQQTYPFYLTGLIRDGESRIWKDDFISAGHFADSIEQRVSVSPFPADSIVRKAVAAYRGKMETRVCGNRKETAEIFCIRAWRNLELLNYAHAGQLLDSSVSLLKDHPECGFDSRPAWDSLKKYGPAILYQQAQRKTELFLTGQVYDSVIPLYVRTEKYFQEKQVSFFGLSSIPLFDFIRSTENRFLTMSAVHYFSDRKEFHEAFRYLDLLRLQETPSKEAKKEMGDIASSLAEKDFAKDPAKDPAVIVNEYTSGFKWFSKFSFRYIYRWNELRKEKGSN